MLLVCIVFPSVFRRDSVEVPCSGDIALSSDDRLGTEYSCYLTAQVVGTPDMT